MSEKIKNGIFPRCSPCFFASKGFWCGGDVLVVRGKEACV